MGAESSHVLAFFSHVFSLGLGRFREFPLAGHIISGHLLMIISGFGQRSMKAFCISVGQMFRYTKMPGGLWWELPNIWTFPFGTFQFLGTFQSYPSNFFGKATISGTVALPSCVDGSAAVFKKAKLKIPVPTEVENLWIRMGGWDLWFFFGWRWDVFKIQFVDI